MPQAGLVLLAGDPDDLAVEQLDEFAATGVVLWELAEQIHLRHHESAIAAAPMGHAIRRLVAVPAMEI